MDEVRKTAPAEAVERSEKSGALVEELARLARTGLPAGQATLTQCADILGMAPRTLQRHLVAAGTSFGEVINTIRTEQLPLYFANQRLRLGDIATMMGYASQSAFTRWHVDRFGITPRAARKSEQQKEAPRGAH
ncbi:MAG: helix-turn-helix domain-containing protein [Sphingomonadales bacterium]|jgi:AraC-like DNA-binding protein|nr:helix-turn-helix domain-containing protein [Sphingomonadales bacterium]